ncbi:TSUP family transporter [Streptomyces oceani]|uniref:TSUP family transporter n=1 Tax=Streptomyces oceani TaxID=1075402 RepID=UPI001BAF89AA|nr:TSUP family transporter [Streptomyces oceani]
MINVLALLGAVISLALGLLGAGGSILAVPAPRLWRGTAARRRHPTSLAVVTVASLGGVLPRQRRNAVRWRVAGVFGAAGIPGAFAGAALGGLGPAALAVSGLRGADGGDRRTHAAWQRRTDRRVPYPRGKSRLAQLPAESIPTGLGVGLLTGLWAAVS